MNTPANPLGGRISPSVSTCTVDVSRVFASPWSHPQRSLSVCVWLMRSSTRKPISDVWRLRESGRSGASLARSTSRMRLSFIAKRSAVAVISMASALPIVQLSLSRLNHWLPGCETDPEVMQGTAQFHHEITDALLPEPDPVFHNATTLHATVDMLDA